MFAADSMLRTPWLRLGIPGVRWIRCPRAVDFVRLGFRPRSATLEPTTEARKADSLRWMACFKERVAKRKKLEAEYVRGGEDLWDAASASQQGGYPEHLVVMVNGLVGSAEDWRFAAEQFVKRLPDKVLVHRSECNSLTLTFDGVDLMGERLAEEVLSVVKRRKGIRKISFVAHSLGGLVARYAVGRLYEPITPMESSLDTENHTDKDIGMEGRIAGLEPMNFITFASPHLGSRGHKQLPFLCGLPFLERRASETAHFIVGRTGKHLFLTDNDDGKPPLLLRMVDDCDDIKFRSALRSFKRRVAYANANFDRDNKYPHIVFVDKGDKINNHNETFTVAEATKDELEGTITFMWFMLLDSVFVEVKVATNFAHWENIYCIQKGANQKHQEEMIRGLTQVSWERVDVKSYWLNSDGADVIFHMMDNFII
ncbi:Putative serine esterase (DUF676) [Musa troglodytarum]|uniref:Serine esterase (DUF676) n=1 Tax=Musa troglodytarum TaxID=320322 RepID=A0A9E7HVV2_9LILI|nr:Putative serine esterase (DUF676) [Musa troglodytarum]